MLTETTLLLVDDDRDDQEIFLTALRKVEKDVICETVDNGQEALQKLNEGAIVPDLILLDMNMPRMNGFQLLKGIKQTERLKNIPVIVYSTTAEWRDVEAAKALGALNYIAKPAKFADLCLLLQSLLRTYCSNNRNRHGN